jgi:hypothetical protein
MARGNRSGRLGGPAGESLRGYEDQADAEAVCSVSPALDAAAFSSGLASFAAGSCATLEIGLECVSQ